MPNLAAFITYVLVTTFTPGPQQHHVHDKRQPPGLQKEPALFYRRRRGLFGDAAALCPFFEHTLCRNPPPLSRTCWA